MIARLAANSAMHASAKSAPRDLCVIRTEAMPLNSLVPLVISSLAFVVSATTLYLTFFRRGRLRATWPAVIYFGPDGRKQDGPNKVFLRTLLYSTSRRGHVVESMHVSLTRSETRQNFSIWVYGESALSRGSGLFVGEQGFASNHHFVLPSDGATFSFVPGQYDLRLFAKCVGDRHSRELLTVRLVVSDLHSAALPKGECGLYFDWGPDQQAYQAHVRDRPNLEIPERLLEGAG